MRRFADVEALESELSRPDPAVVDALSGISGDLLVLGAGGKMGPTLSRMARCAFDGGEVIAVSRFSDARVRRDLEAHRVRTIACDLLDGAAVRALPDAAVIVFLAGMKFGTRAAPWTAWARNAWLPALVADRFRGRPAVVLSSGNVYPFVSTTGLGASESTPPAPVGEYAWSVLARERMFEHFAREAGTPVAILRLNYATDLRYGVLVDIAKAVRDGLPIDLETGWVNTIWQRDANAWILRSLGLASSPPAVLNITGPERLSVRELANRFGGAFDRRPVLAASERDTALLSDATRACELFGMPSATADQIIEWTAAWVGAGLPTLEAPTHFECRDGSF